MNQETNKAKNVVVRPTAGDPWFAAEKWRETAAAAKRPEIPEFLKADFARRKGFGAGHGTSKP
jgi:hypothetical protein